ncbi:MAG: hypothetical protein CL840_04730 [Crocinitomicaceae bacterium]|nr:hypothetical protein [Crocinitomicaceae bacterium]
MVAPGVQIPPSSPNSIKEQIMQPMGRKKIVLPGGKHRVKDHGKNIAGWWEDIAQPNKTSARMKAKTEIRQRLSCL